MLAAACGIKHNGDHGAPPGRVTIMLIVAPCEPCAHGGCHICAGLAAGGIEYGSGRREADGGTDRLLFDARLEARQVVQLVPAP